MRQDYSYRYEGEACPSSGCGGKLSVHMAYAPDLGFHWLQCSDCGGLTLPGFEFMEDPKTGRRQYLR